MGLLKCKHKIIKVISCRANEKRYIVQCVKCGAQWTEPKAEGEEYSIGVSIKR